MYFGKSISYQEMFDEIEKVAKAFTFYGVKQNDNVAICMPATPETIYTVLALNRIGANVCMLNPTFTEQQLTDRILELNAKILIIVNELYSAVEKVVPQVGIQTVVACPATNSLGLIAKVTNHSKKIDGTIDWKSFLKKGKDAAIPPTPVYKKEQAAIMVYSSGTTGASKGIQLTNDSINATITEYGISGFSFERQERYFAQIPIWYSTGIVVTMLVPLFYGVAVILEPIYDFDLFYKHIVKYHPNHLVTATGLIDYLMSKQEQSPAYAVFKYLVVGGEYVTPYAEEKINCWLEKNGCKEHLHKGYGMCECGGTVTSTSSFCNVIGASGIPLPHVTVAAFDLQNGKELPYGQRGELRVLTPCRMSGYYNRPDATKEYFYNDELGRIWACTGDMGYVVEDGNIYVDGRISDSYTDSQGETIYLFDIERAILTVKEVRQCKVVAVELDGKTTHVAHVVLSKDGKHEQALKQIIDACDKKLDTSHRPHLFRFYTDALPVAPSGKLDTTKMKSDIMNLETT